MKDGQGISLMINVAKKKFILLIKTEPIYSLSQLEQMQQYTKAFVSSIDQQTTEVIFSQSQRSKLVWLQQIKKGRK